MNFKSTISGILAFSLIVSISSCKKEDQSHAFTGYLEADGIQDMAFNYSPDNDLIAVRTIEIVPDSTGRFIFPDSLVTDGGLHSQILADNDYFGIYLEPGKSVEGKITRDSNGKLQIAFTGDNSDINTYYNALCQAFDSMKYFDPDSDGSSSVDKYFALLEKENAGVLDASIIQDPEKRKYYEKMRDRMYTWSKIRLLMDQAYDQGLDEREMPEYVELVNTIDPNDDLSLQCTLIFPWLNMQSKSSSKDGLPYYIEQLRILDQSITNPNTRKVMLNQLPYTYFAYAQPTQEDAETYLQEYSKIAAAYPELIETYKLRAAGIKEINAGDALNYDPVIETPEGKKLKLSDLAGKVTYIDFWATWCGPCVKQIPYLEKLVEKMKGNDNVAFVSISSDSDREAWLKKLKKDNPDWPQYIFDFEDGNKFMTAMNITGIPRFMILNADGTVAVADALRPSDEGVEAQILSFVK